MTEQQYLDSLAIYNPNGGYRAGKIYDVRDFSNSQSSIMDFSLDRYTTANSTLEEETTETLDFGYGDKTYKLTATANFNGAHINSGTKPTVSTVYNHSVYAKQGTARYVALSLGNLGAKTIFDLQDGVVTSGTGVITSEGNGWFRCSISDSFGGADIYARIEGSVSPTSVDTTGKTGTYIYLYGNNINSTSELLPYSRLPKRDLTVTGGGGTRINAAGNVEDIGYYNLMPYSDDFTNANWIKGSSTVTPNYGISPTGGNNATRWLSNVGVSNHYLAGQLALPLDTYTISCWVKSNGANNRFRLFLDNTVMSGDMTATSEWVRYSFTSSGVSSISSKVHGLSRPADNSAVDLLIWGLQVEQGSSATAFQLNTGTAAFPKIDHSTGQAAFLFEPTVTNYIKYSNDFQAAPWTFRNGAVLTPNNAISPDGTMNAHLVTGNGSTSEFFTSEYQGNSSASGATCSIWVRSVTGTVGIQLLFADGSVDSANYDQVRNINETWTRISSYDSGTFVKGLFLRQIPSSGIYIYEAQHTLGNILSSVIPTNGAAVTRTSTLNKTSIPTTIPKSIFLDTEITNIGTDKILHNFHNAAAAGQYFFQAKIDTAGDLVVGVLNNYNNSTGGTSGLITLGLTEGRHKFMFCYTANLEMKVFVDGVEYTINMTCCGLSNNLDTLSIGSQQSGETTNHFNDSMYDVRVWSTDESAQGITLTTL